MKGEWSQERQHVAKRVQEGPARRRAVPTGKDEAGATVPHAQIS